MKNNTKKIFFLLISIVILITLALVTVSTINKNKANKDYEEIQKQLLKVESPSNILQNKKFYDSKKGEGTRRVIFKDDKEIEYNVYLSNGQINIEPLYYDSKKYKDKENTKHYYAP